MRRALLRHFQQLKSNCKNLKKNKRILQQLQPQHLHLTYPITQHFSSTPPSHHQILKERELAMTRNIAIIAHVDHGKTSLVDCLLQQSGCKVANQRMMDSNELEQERGITILSKCTSLVYKGYKVNVVDTPGHSDFGGEVERIMGMVEAVVLVVCATEGVMAQTKFVLQKALRQNLKVIVVINKVDRPSARVEDVENDVFGLFVDLEADDQVLDYPIYYASAKHFWAAPKQENTFNLHNIDKQDTTCILDAVLSHCSQPRVDIDRQHFTMLVSQIEFDDYFGKMLIGKIHSGEVHLKDVVQAVDQQGQVVEHGQIQRIIVKYGQEKLELDKATAGDIISISGLGEKASVSHSINQLNYKHVLKSIEIDPPMISINMTVNTSPIAGQEGTKLSKLEIWKRLMLESESDVSLRITDDIKNNMINIQGRGDLHLGILIEKMRREGFEMSVTPPEVVYRYVNGNKQEPMEKLEVEVNEEHSAKVIEVLQNRKGQYEDCETLSNNRQKLTFTVPTRALIGFRTVLLQETAGSGIMNVTFIGYEDYKGPVKKNQKGALIAKFQGLCSSYGINNLEKFGQMFVKNQSKVYPGMVFGEHIKEIDIELNPIKEKKLNNIRTVLTDDSIKLMPPRVFTLEEAIAYVRDDEMIEVTPQNIRIRKVELDPSLRKRANSRKN